MLREDRIAGSRAPEHEHQHARHWYRGGRELRESTPATATELFFLFLALVCLPSPSIFSPISHFLSCTSRGILAAAGSRMGVTYFLFVLPWITTTPPFIVSTVVQPRFLPFYNRTWSMV